MTQWNSKLEALIRKVSDYTDTQMKDLLNQKSTAGGSALRITFRGVTRGLPLMKETCKEAGFEFKGNWMRDLQKLVTLAEENNSNAAENIKKALPVAERLMKDFKQQPGGMLKKIKVAKQQKIQY